MTERPLADKDIWALESYFNNNPEDAQALSLLVYELAHRNDTRSILLMARAESRITKLEKHTSKSSPNVKDNQIQTNRLRFDSEEIESKRKTKSSPKANERPLANRKIFDLFNYFEKNISNREELKTLLEELEHRSETPAINTPRPIIELRGQVRHILEALDLKPTGDNRRNQLAQKDVRVASSRSKSIDLPQTNVRLEHGSTKWDQSEDDTSHDDYLEIQDRQDQSPPPSQEKLEITERLIADLRKRLLDLRNNNRLLNFPFSERSRTHVRVIDELPDVLYKRLIDLKTLFFKALPDLDPEPPDEKPQKFRIELEAARVSDEIYLQQLSELNEDEDITSPKGRKIERSLKNRLREQLGMPPRPSRETISAAEYATTQGLDPSYDLPTPDAKGQDADRHLDDDIQTLLFPDQMERKLSGLRDQTRTGLQEMGINTLFSAFGYLEWYESPDSDRRFLAPLLLHPLQIERKLQNQVYRYNIQSTGGDTDINLTLKERLRNDFGMELPEFEEDDTPETYFTKVAQMIEPQAQWRIRRFVTVGLFHFSRLVMYHDLDPKRWPENRGLHNHEVLLDLLGGAEPSEDIFVEEYEVDQPDISKKVPILITDADSSQFSAIVDVMSGKNMAIKGPPGTGKSQTITNIIAAALQSNKRVLFLSEKMAALEVVKKRLDAAGLGVFCLELHSTKARKKDVLTALGERLKIPRYPDPQLLDDAILEHQNLREELTKYADLINNPYGKTGKSLQEILWAEQVIRDRLKEAQTPSGIEELDDKAAVEMTEYNLARAHSKLGALEASATSIIDNYGTIRNHPWYGVDRSDLSLYDQEELRKLFAEWRTALAAIRGVITELSQLCEIDCSTSIMAVCELKDSLMTKLPEEVQDVDLDILANLTGNFQVECIGCFLDDCRRYIEIRASLEKSIDNPIIPIEQVSKLTDVGDLYAKTVAYADHSMPSRVNQIPEYVQWVRSQVAKVNEDIKTAKDLYRLIGFDGEMNISNIKQIIEAFTDTATEPRDILLRRNQILMDELSGEDLERGSRIVKNLRERRAEIGEHLALSLLEDSGIYRSYALTLRTTGFFGRFGGDYKAAIAEYRILTRGKGLKQSRGKMASDFDMIAEFLDEIYKFANDSQLVAICGNEFRGLDTPFDKLIAVNNYSSIVRKKYAGNDSMARSLREILLNGSIEQLDSVFTIVKSHEFRLLQDDARSLLRTEVNIDNFETIQRNWNELAGNCEKMHKDLKALGIKDDFTLKDITQLAGDIEELSKIAAGIEANEEAKSVLDEYFNGSRSDIDHIAHTHATAASIMIAGLPAPVVNRLLTQNYYSYHSNLTSLLVGLDSLIEQENTACEKAIEFGQIDSCEMFQVQDFEEFELDTILERLDRSLEAIDHISEWIDFCRTRNDVLNSGYGKILDAYDEAAIPYCDLQDAYDWVFYRSIIRRALREFPELNKFSGISHEALRKRFQELDHEIIDLQTKKLASKLSWASISQGIGTGNRSGWTNLSLIKNEIGKKKRHIPMRDLLKRSGTAIQEMKPCFMMSPASVAQYIQPDGGVAFDFVIIDEASQMKPEEALGAIVRGKKLVVVGDPQQLPPTSFFDRIDLPTEDELESEDYIDNESILDLALTTFRPTRELRWHYRSRHESLIAFSNKHFYKDNLIVFPSPRARHDDFGVEYCRVEGTYKGRVNVAEAQAVVGAAVDFMRKHPDRSLGIVTMNQTQREILVDEMDMVFATNRHAENYRQKWETTLESLFVKNLENVQGDERDVIFISTVYGPNENGQVMQRFGPINGAGGHRRLNVLFTRAKEKVVVFSSMDSSQVIPTETSHEGVGILKNYLDYSKTNRLEVGEDTGREPDSDFEIFVAERLRRQGYTVAPQVGVAGYFIDMAVKDPNNPDNYILGIECDGRTYHSAKSARDRDRLRQEVIEGLGWNLYRIWSTDWFNDPDGQTKKLLSHLQSLVYTPSDIDLVADSEETEVTDAFNDLEDTASAD